METYSIFLHHRNSTSAAYDFEGYSLPVLPIRIKTVMRERDKNNTLIVPLYLSFSEIFSWYFLSNESRFSKHRLL